VILRAPLLSPARGCEVRETASSDLELGLVTELDSVRDEWEALACAAGNPFLTPQWAETWLRLCGECCEPRVFAARRGDGGLAAIVPLVIVRGRYARKARFLGFGPANELGPLLAPADAALAPDLLRRAVTAIRREWDVFLAEKLPGQGWAQRVGGVTMARKAAPLVTGPWESWDAYLASRSRDFRQ